VAGQIRQHDKSMVAGASRLGRGTARSIWQPKCSTGGIRGIQPAFVLRHDNAPGNYGRNVCRRPVLGWKS
jgi:hypothetical protein